MKLGEIYTSGHTGSETLKVIRTYGDKMASLKVGDTDNRIMASEYNGVAKLCLAHVSSDMTILTSKGV